MQGEKCNLEKYQLSAKIQAKSKYFSGVFEIAYRHTYGDSTVTLEEIIKQEKDFIFNSRMQFENFEFHCDFLKKTLVISKFGSFSYVPVLIIPEENIPVKFKILVTAIAYVLGKIQGTNISSAEIIYGRKFKSSRIKVENYLKEFHKTVHQLKESDKFFFHLNAHCSICEFSKTCREKAVREDHLSLLKGISLKKIKELNNKGIFTTNQLSFTFRPKRKSLKGENKKRSRSVELQALAIREKKIFVYGSPSLLPAARTEMFLDIEGIPAENYYYLIGLAVKTEKGLQHQHFWANSREEEQYMVEGFLMKVLNYDDFIIYHYGNYETIFLQKMKDRLPLSFHDIINNILGHCYNILSVIYSHIYFPTYSNSLKEIGKLIGFNWSEQNATGIESIFWRKTWEVSSDNSLKQKLITYNREDCSVLIYLKEVINAVIINNNIDLPRLASGNVKDLLKEQKTTFIGKEAFFPEMKFINECSYFDYQREKVYAKTNGLLRKASRERKKQKKYFYHFKPNQTVFIKSQSCNKCKSKRVDPQKELSKKIIDLKFTGTGVRVFITRYYSYKYVCRKCKHFFTPPDYPSTRLKLGHNLICWTIFQHIANKQGFRSIENNFRELFHLYLSRDTFFACKNYFIRYYEETYNELVSTVTKSDVLYVDETPFEMQFEKGYVWVFTNGEQVVSIFRPNREAGFLKDFLKDFKGVLVTDFYSGYDAINCPHQKCLIHLIRDFNSDLIRHPFNDEFKTVAKDFTVLLQKIVATIDRFGLKQYHLNKYKKETTLFFAKISASAYQTEIAQQYQIRLKRNRNTLFEFLCHNNVSWNNSNAEHAIKILALHANKNINAFRKSRIDDYLKIMSIYQTCEFINISFLKFLLSKKKSIGGFLE